MPRYWEVFEKRHYILTFPTYIVRYRQTTFYRLKPTFWGNVSFNYVNLSFVHFSAQNSVFYFKIFSAKKYFQKRHKNTLKDKQCRDDSLLGLTLHFWACFNKSL